MASRYPVETIPAAARWEYVHVVKWDVFSRTCPSRELLDRIADKRTVLVIRALERDGAVVRRVYTGSPLRVTYALTPLGRYLHRVVDGLGSWAERNLERVAEAQVRFDNRAVEST